jgi:hypothetical protein
VVLWVLKVGHRGLRPEYWEVAISEIDFGEALYDSVTHPEIFNDPAVLAALYGMP